MYRYNYSQNANKNSNERTPNKNTPTPSPISITQEIVRKKNKKIEEEKNIIYDLYKYQHKK